ncbi:MAG: 4-hydroxy-3-methylbut-2-enyl diphosphate reductase [Proteobacteria bacterium]|nr:4-hydroxy-3-methylbut-2-enyl diphosphate reductase [Pseudomonadota bacterium]
MEIYIARSAGFCYGVKRAINLAKKTLSKSKENCFTLGPIIHNPFVVEELEKQGLKVVDSVKDIKKGTLVIRSHGISKQEKEYLDKMGRKVSVVDATCPFVEKALAMLEILKKEGYEIFYLGDKNHPEVRGLLSYINNQAVVFEKPEDIPEKKYKKVGLISQTTQKPEVFKRSVEKLLPLCEELRVFNTICKTTTIRQREAKDLAKKVDLMIVLGGKISANTKKLAEICREELEKTYHIETAKDLKKSWFKGVKKVGITAGASTPREHIKEVVEFLKNLGE